ncbi:hypothetical protein HKD37_10G027568 [Glycine soja]
MDEIVGLQEVLEVDLGVINKSLANVDGGGEEIDVDLLKQLDLVEPYKDECILSENEIENKGRGGDRRTFNRGRRCGVTLGASVTTNPSTSSIHISTLELMIHELIPTTPVRDASPLAPDDSLTPKYPRDSNCEHIANRRPFIFAHKREAKFDEPVASWLKVLVDLRNRWFGEFKIKGSLILKNVMNKIRNGQDKGTWILANSFTAKANRTIDKGASAYCGGSISKAGHFKKLSKEFQRPPIAWEKYQHHREEIQQHSTEEDTSTYDSCNITTSINYNEIYLNVVGGLNYKGNVYGLGTLRKRFNCSKLALSTPIAPVEDQIEEMYEAITKLNAELLAKANKERTLEEKMLQLMENYDQQS